MRSKYANVLGNMTLIALLVLMSFLRISLIKFPYWMAALALVYYSLSYKFSLSGFDKMTERKIPKTQRKIVNFILCFYSGGFLLMKTSLLISSFTNPMNSYLKNDFIQKEVLAVSEGKYSTVFIFETICEIALFVISLLLIIFSNSEKNGSDCDKAMGEQQTNLNEIYSEYKMQKTWKTISYIAQFLIVSWVLIFNVSIINLPIFVLFGLKIIFSVFHSHKCLDYINKLYAFIVFSLLNFHYIKNTAQLKYPKLDNLLGVVNFESTISVLFFAFASISYANSCNILRYSMEEEHINKIKSSVREEKVTLIQEFEKNDPGYYLTQSLKNTDNFVSKISSVCYNITLLFCILFHVCILMFINFLFLLFGINKANKNWKNCFVIPSFLLSLFFLTLQYVFNMSGVFVFGNVQVYKWLEIFGIYKYYKAKVNSDYSNIQTLDESSEDKIKGMLADVILVMLLLVFACAINTSPKKEKEEAISEELEDKEMKRKNRKGQEWMNFIVEKSFLLCLVFMFICSIVKFDLLHVIYFAFFVILISVGESSFKSLWDFILLVNSIIIIIVLYFWNILALNFLDLEKETNPANENIFTYLGLKINKNGIFFVEYWEHICLYIFGFIHNYIVTALYQTDSDDGKIRIKNLYKFPEWSRKIFLGLAICTMLILTVIKPLSFQGLFFLSYCLIFLAANLFIISAKKGVIIGYLINILLVLSVIMLIMKYSINFAFLVNYFKDKLNLEDAPTNNEINPKIDEFTPTSNAYTNDFDNPNIKNFSIQDFGLDSKNLNIKLLINAFLIIVSKILTFFNTYNGKSENIEENVSLSLEKPNKLKDVPIKENEKFFVYIKVFFYQLIYLHACKIMFIVTVFICVCLESMIGVIIFGVVLFTLFLELRSGWRYSFFPLIFTSIIFMCFTYMCNMSAFKKWMTKDYEWFGLYNSKSSHVILHDLLPYVTIIFFAFLTRISSTFKSYYKEEEKERPQMEEEENRSLIRAEDDMSDTRNLISYGSEEKENEVAVDVKPKSDESGERKNILASPLESSDEQKGNNSSFLNSYVKMNVTTVSAISSNKYEDEIISTLSRFWKNLDYFWYLYGFYVVLVTIMLVSFIKVNVLSLIFMTFVGFQSFGIYLRTEFITKKEDINTPNLKRIKKTWMIFASFLAIFSLLQYINYMWFPPSWKISKPWEHLSFFCSKEGKTIYSNNIHFKNTSDFEYCVADWKAWLNIDNYGTKDIFYNFICLFLLLITHKYFTDEEIFKRKRFEEHANSQVDFTITENRKHLGETVKYFLFIYLKSLILFYIILISIIYSYRYTNLIYGGFLFISFYLLFKDSALAKKKNQLWKYVQYYNYLVLVGFMLFQTPFLPCPVNRDGRSYMGLQECVEEENKLYQTSMYEYPKNKVDALYMVMVQTIGMLKLDFKLLIVGNLSLFLIYIVALIQQIIFEHPYQSIIDSYYEREKQINCKSRAFKIVQDSHLHIYTEYRQLFTFMEILKSKLDRLGKKIVEYGDLWKSYKWNNDNEESEKMKKKQEIIEVEEKMKGEIEAMVDELFSNDRHLAGWLDYKIVKETVERIHKEKFKDFIKEMEDQGKSKNLDEKEDLEQKYKDSVLEGLVGELRHLFAEQFIQDKLHLFKHDHHGLNIAREIFEQMVAAETEHPLIISSTKKDIELLKKLFSDRVPIIPAEIRNENQPNQEERVNTSLQLERRLSYQPPTLENNIPNDPQYHNYIKRLKFKKKVIGKDDSQDKGSFSYYNYIIKQLWKSVDKVLLIDLTTNRKTKLTNLFELLFFSIYSNIEVFIVLAFIINHCVEASIISMIYPLSYFGYGLVEYPFTNKYYWKAMIVYSLVTITVKLVYQFPFFCGYPFYAVFNIFNESYCEYYPLSDQEITEGLDFIIGLRKYNGEYSYPKNAGLFYGILWDIIILCLLLVMRSLLKSKGVWSFITINNEFTKVPAFEASKVDVNSEQLSNGNYGSNKSLSESFSLFWKRMVPELYMKQNNNIIYKPGADYYPLSFAAMLVILIYTMVFFGSLTGKSGQGIQDALDKQQFSKDLVWTVLIIVTIIVLDRIIYKLRSISNEFIYEKFKKNEQHQYNSQESLGQGREFTPAEKDHIQTSNNALTTKLWMHYTILLGTHILLFFLIPLSTKTFFFSNSSLVFLYILCCVYFYFSSKQIKYGFPLATKGQYFADSTQLSNRVAFKIYRNVPFLYELRAILDWTITKTSLDLFQWFKMEDAYANLYEVKCDMDVRKFRANGEDRWWVEKVLWGFCSFLFLMFILILPMILFSSFNPNLVENKVLGGSFKINLELKSPEPPNTTIYNLNLFDLSTLKVNNLKDHSHYEYLKNFLIAQVDDVEERKVQKVKVVNYSQLDWILSPPAINSLLKHLEKKTDCYITIEWEFRREFPINNKNILGNKVVQLNREQIATLRNIIFALKNHQSPEKYSLLVKDAFPKVIRLSNRQWKYIKFDPKHKTPHKENTDLQIQLMKENERDIYWKINQVDIKNVDNSPFYNKNDELSFLLINDDVISSFFGFNSDGSMPLSIIGIYATLVYTVGKFVRIFFDKISQRVIYEEMPDPNDLFELCEGVYIYRNERNLKEENYLYDLLIRIYRSPETLIKITGTKVKYRHEKIESN